MTVTLPTRLLDSFCLGFAQVESNLKWQIKLHLPNSTPDQAIFAPVLGMPRLTV
jgi:hypothetical protein